MKTVFTPEQQRVLLTIWKMFSFSERNYKYSICAFLSDDSVQKADELILEARELGLEIRYLKSAIPAGVTGRVRESYQKFGRSVLLNDQAANWFVSQPLIRT